MLIALWKAHILKLHPSSWRCNLKIWMHLDHMLKFLFLDATWSFKIKMITFARLYKPLLEDDSSSFTLVQSWNFDPKSSIKLWNFKKNFIEQTQLILNLKNYINKILPLSVSNHGVQPLNKFWCLKTTFQYKDWKYFIVKLPLTAQALIL